MQKRVILGLLVASALVAGCSAAGTPKAVVPLSEVDFGDVPVITDMRDAKLKLFNIKNEGNGDLKLTSVDVKTLEGC